MDYQAFINATNEMADEINQNAVDHGFYEDAPSLPERLMLMVTELSEALEEHRDGKPVTYLVCNHWDDSVGGKPCRGCGIAHRAEPCGYRGKKPEGIGVELADCAIRILDTCSFQGIDIGTLIVEKHEYNKTRPYKHGGKLI